MVELKFYKLDKNAHEPTVGSQWAACFDLKAFIGAEKITYYDKQNNKKEVTPLKGNDKVRYIQLMPKCRYIVPTGLILDIPEGHSVRLHPRSGLSLKQGLGLANLEGVIDCDYVDPLFILLENRSDAVVKITDGMRVCQGELVEDMTYLFNQTDEKPETKTDRNGGLGSTGH